jgi:hypothetical protein
MKTNSTTTAAQRCWLVASVLVSSVLVASLLGLTWVGLMPQSASAQARALAPRAGRAVVLQTFHAGQFVLELVIAECRQSECPMEVRLRSGGRVVDRVALPVAARSRRAQAEIVDEIWGADPGLTAWATGVENSHVSTAARMLRLAPQTTALLVSQRYGFEHVKRNHLVILPRAGKLTIAWKVEEGAGPTWSATRTIRGQSGRRHEVVYENGFYEPEEDAADRLDVARLRWDDASARLPVTLSCSRRRPLSRWRRRQSNSRNALCEPCPGGEGGECGQKVPAGRDRIHRNVERHAIERDEFRFSPPLNQSPFIPAREKEDVKR